MLKLKKSGAILIALCAFLALGARQAEAQTVGVTLNLYAIQAIALTTSAVTLNVGQTNYKDYTDGVSNAALANDLTVFSTESFSVNVSAAAFTGTGTPPAIGDLNITAVQGGTNQGTASTIETLTGLTTAPQKLVTAAGGAYDTYNLVYSIKGTDLLTAASAAVSGTPSVYTTTITYTITHP